ncbi:zinc finger domain-containing protein [Encephalitozoon intestinalis ATCC 50506]|uniref:Zinc finger domain-containing protein n=1 Tax=Encephalitozoon intestinalis (strain ATCC 50506) TaxID=876142 RepID=E0S5F0_ENCIT|nr:zinc finger domain-containing protein [Encephalitozoon intestinalis ATCC 50506]ADM10935.1 zinc finger domain-containing protein [Encephalitozoon intestinalis ATCC 50506]UTX44570.1 zinc finger domain-containing protein [Encephalitozoon intestinalis]
MDIFGGKVGRNPWTIETTSIDTSDCKEDHSIKCQCLQAKRTFRSKGICSCIKDNGKLSHVGSISHVSTPSNTKEQGVFERRQKAHDYKATTQGYPPSGKGSHANKKYQLYKTEMCRSHTEIGYCKYGDKCQFAHSKTELRYVQRHPKYKTETCKTFWEEGSCPYGKRCCFIHIPNIDIVNLSLHGYQEEDDKRHEAALGIEIDNPHDEVVFAKIDGYMLSSEEGLLYCPESSRKEGEEEWGLKVVYNSYSGKDHGPGIGHRSPKQSFEPIVEEESSEEIMLKRPFWESNYSKIWMEEETSLFYVPSPCKRKSESRALKQEGADRPFNKKISDFVFEYLGM